MTYASSTPCAPSRRLTALAASTAMLMLVLQLNPATAQDFATPATYAVPAGSLADSLDMAARQAGITLSYNSAEVEQFQAAPLNGTMTAHEAIDQLLAGTGLEFEQIGAGTATIKVANSAAVNGEPPNETVLLAPVEVEGRLVGDNARAGLFGDRPIQDIPFSVTSFTEDLMERQQSRRLGDVLENDPSVRNGFARSSAIDLPVVRGFSIFNSEIAVDGLFGMTANNANLVEPFSRVEVLRGPNALLNGVPPFGSIGGTINMVPKRATDFGNTDLSLSFESDRNFGTHIDVGRRFGPNGEFGARFNGVFRGGSVAIDDSSNKIGLASLALDYRGERLRVTGDFYYANETYDASISSYRIRFTGAPLPDAPDSENNSLQPFSEAKYTTLRAIVGFEYDLLDSLTVNARYGVLRGTEENIDLASATNIQNTQGDTTGFFFSRDTEFNNQSVDGGLTAFLTTGPVDHELSIQASLLDFETDEASFFATELNGVTLDGGSIFNPVRIEKPDFPALPARTPRFDQTFRSVAISDIVSAFDDRLQLSFGVRIQDLEINNVRGGASIDQTEVTPAVGLIVKPIEELSLYGSYSQALTPGPITPSGAANPDEVLDPFVSEQIEFGAKWASDGFGASLALFQITQPQGILDPVTNIFSSDGEIRNRGIEALVYGDVTEDFRILGGFLLQNGEQTNTAGGTFDGNDGIAFPTAQLNIYAEYDVPPAPGLTVNGRVIYTSSQFLDAANEQSIPGWVRFDLGASYDFEVAGTETTLNFDVLNVAGNDYWQSTGRSALSLSPPRTFLVTTQFSF